MPEYEPDPIEAQLQLTRSRSVVNGRFSFSFAADFDRTIFPIIHQPRGGRPRLIGAGFFILPWGLFVTAGHLFEGNDIADDDAFDALVDLGGGNLRQIPIEEIHRSEERDVAFGIVSMESDAPIVPVMQLPPIVTEGGAEPIGAPVFAHTLVQELRPLSPDEVLFQRRYHWELGYAEEIHEHGRGFVRGRCFSTNIFAEGRSSGSPVFNSNGFVVGLVSMGLTPPDGQLPYSVITSIQEALDVPVNGQTVWEHRRQMPNNPIVSVSRVQSADN